MENQIVVVGNLTADPELRYTQSGQAVANFTIAQTKRKRDPQNPDKWVDSYTNFFRCTAWREAAENVAETGRKGQRWIVIGETVTEEYNDKKSGELQRSTNNINVDECGPSQKWDSYTQNPRKGGQGGARGGNGQSRQQSGGGFGNGNQQGGGFPGQGGGFPGQQSGGQQGGGRTDPWSGGNSGDDEPPF